MPTETPVRITRILELGSHNIESLADGSVDIVDAATIGEKEYVHLSEEEAYKLLAALQAQLTGAMNA